MNAEKHSPPQAVELSGAGKRGGGRIFRGPIRPVTNSMVDRRDVRNPQDLWADICNHRPTVAPVITSIQGLDNRQRGSAIP